MKIIESLRRLFRVKSDMAEIKARRQRTEKTVDDLELTVNGEKEWLLHTTVKQREKNVELNCACREIKNDHAT